MGSIERFLAHAALLGCGCWGAPAQAEPSPSPAREQCLAQHEQAQDLRLSGRMLAARDALRECSANSCPTLVRKDCLAWLSDVQQQIPSVIFSGSKDGEDLVSLRIREGETLLTESLTGTPLELDPGPHRFVAELAGFPAQEATYMLQAGDKSRVVRFEFVSPLAAPPPAPAVVGAPPLAPSVAGARPIPSISYALAGASLAAIVTGSVLGTLALSKRQEVDHRCAPLCEDADVRSVEGLALGADVAFALAALTAGGAVYTYLARPNVATVSLRPALRVTGRGVSLGAGGVF